MLHENGSVSVMLTCYKRPELLEAQLMSILGQSLRPEVVRIWNNSGNPLRHIDGVTVITPSANMGVWPRFYACLDMPTEFTAIFDDDTIPGHRWLEHCVASFRQQPALYGAAGVIFPEGRRDPRWYGRANRVGPPLLVDIVGHCWFLPTDWLRYFAGEPRTSDFDTCGEDYHLAWAIQKHERKSCLIPEVPEDRAFWGTLHPDLGADSVALYRQPGEEEKKRVAHDALRNAGWMTIKDEHDRLIEYVSPTAEILKDDFV